MAETTNYQCPNCNGRLFFNGELNQLQCEFCESTFSTGEIEALYGEKQSKADAAASGDRVERVAAEAAAGSAADASTAQATRVQTAYQPTGDPIQDYIAQSKWTSSDLDNMRAYNCPSCGAQLMVDEVTAVTSCPYCGNNTVVPGQLSDVLKPDYVIPFKLDKDAAIAALKNYYKGKKLLPNSFSDDNHIQEIQGVYVPFWLYSGAGTGSIMMNARNVTTWMDSHNTYVKTDHYQLHRAGKMDFHRVPVDGSTKMPDNHMDAIEPYDYSELVPFSVAYLPGYLTDRYDQAADECSKRAERRVCHTVTEQLEATATGYMESDLSSSTTQMNIGDIAYALLPVWMLHTKWNGQDYLFAMNGQTGKFIGDLPVDNGKAVRRFLMLFLPLLVVMVAIVVFLLLGM